MRDWPRITTGLKTSLCSFLAVQNSSIGDLVTHSLTQSVTEGTSTLTYKERPYRPVTFETFYQSDEETGPDQKKYKDKEKYKDKDNDKDKDKNI